MTTNFTSNDQTPAVIGENTNAGVGINGKASGVSVQSLPVGVYGESTDPGAGIGILGRSHNLTGVQGEGKTEGVFGRSLDGIGVSGRGGPKTKVPLVFGGPQITKGVFGISDDGVGVWGESTSGNGVAGWSSSPENIAAMAGTNLGPGPGVYGNSYNGTGSGVKGESNKVGVEGVSAAGTGVFGRSNSGSGVMALSHDGHGLDAFSDNDIGIFSRGGKFAGVFDGNVDISKDLTVAGDVILRNPAAQDCAEFFAISLPETAEPGTVMVIMEEGALRPSYKPYDKKVAGVISGAGSYKPGIVLGKQDLQDHQVPIALLGKVYCKVDAQDSRIEVGDLLTTSSTPGHAMKADPSRAFGAVIGKALSPVSSGQALIPILIALQ